VIAAFNVFWFVSGGSVAVSGWKLVLYFPQWFYQVVTFFFSPINWIISFLAARVPFYKRRLPDYDLNPHLSPRNLLASISKEQIEEVSEKIRTGSKDYLDERVVMSLFDSLPPISNEDMLKNWSGNIVRTGSLLDLVDVLLKPVWALGLRWGKRYRSPHIGDPLLFNLWNTFYFPVPVWGNVSIPNIAYRGKVTATMVYDHWPWMDYFRVLEEGGRGEKKMLLGVWTAHEKIGGWFTLTENTSLNKATASFHCLNAWDSYQESSSNFSH